MRNATRLLCLAALALVTMHITTKEAAAQYPVYYGPVVQPVAPAVVGYTARRAGFFGRRVIVRPVVAPVVAAPAPVVVARPVVAAPVVPVTAYYPPAVAVPVTTYRAPVIWYGY